MELQDLLNNRGMRCIKHRNNIDVVFKPNYVVNSDDKNAYMYGWWINVASEKPFPMIKESITIKLSDLHNWQFTDAEVYSNHG